MFGNRMCNFIPHFVMDGYNVLFMLGLKLTHVCKTHPWCTLCYVYTITSWFIRGIEHGNVSGYKNAYARLNFNFCTGDVFRGVWCILIYFQWYQYHKPNKIIVVFYYVFIFINQDFIQLSLFNHIDDQQKHCRVKLVSVSVLYVFIELLLIHTQHDLISQKSYSWTGVEHLKVNSTNQK